MLSYLSILLQGSLGYSALAAGAATLPMGLSLITLSTRVGTIAGRIGARRFMTAGPLSMAAGLLWFARIPATSAPWHAAIDRPASLVPPIDFVIDVVPGILLFGIGIACVVAPLTSTLMGSVPGRFSGLASAINNAIARVGQPLLGAIIFLAISATFYATLGALAPGLETNSDAVRAVFSPLNPPRGAATPDQAAAAVRASVEAFHLAMIVAASLLAVGSAVSWIGLRGSAPKRARESREAYDSAVDHPAEA
jgi:hypothetical protein